MLSYPSIGAAILLLDIRPLEGSFFLQIFLFKYLKNAWVQIEPKKTNEIIFIKINRKDEEKKSKTFHYKNIFIYLYYNVTICSIQLYLDD